MEIRPTVHSPPPDGSKLRLHVVGTAAANKWVYEWFDPLLGLPTGFDIRGVGRAVDRSLTT